eukprot:m.150434 g.150434  ORF g.150434 m.150434 type:complete len:150 (-) comp13283_c0_seq8:3606-4055(-)
MDTEGLIELEIESDTNEEAQQDSRPLLFDTETSQTQVQAPTRTTTNVNDKQKLNKSKEENEEVIKRNNNYLHEEINDDKEDDKTLNDFHGDRCQKCNRKGDLLLCDGCPRCYHLHCVVPPLETVSMRVCFKTICCCCFNLHIHTNETDP